MPERERERERLDYFGGDVGAGGRVWGSWVIWGVSGHGNIRELGVGSGGGEGSGGVGGTWGRIERR